MVTTGGAGPVHACGVAEKLGLKHVIVPPLAGVGSAFGFMTAPISFDFTRSYVSRLDSLNLAELNAILDNLEKEGRAIVEAAGVPAEDILVQLSIDMRYVGQGYEVRVPFAKQTLTTAHITHMQKAFEAEYKQFYGQLANGVPIEAVNWRVVIASPKPEIGKLSLESKESETHIAYTTRPVIFKAENEPHMTPVYRRHALSPGWQAHGPLIIEEAASTTVVLPGWSAQVAESGCLLLTHEGNQS
jgi:N-methylhydantoinase A